MEYPDWKWLRERGVTHIIIPLVLTTQLLNKILHGYVGLKKKKTTEGLKRENSFITFNVV